MGFVGLTPTIPTRDHQLEHIQTCISSDADFTGFDTETALGADISLILITAAVEEALYANLVRVVTEPAARTITGFVTIAAFVLVAARLVVIADNVLAFGGRVAILVLDAESTHSNPALACVLTAM